MDIRAPPPGVPREQATLGAPLTSALLSRDMKQSDWGPWLPCDFGGGRMSVRRGTS